MIPGQKKALRIWRAWKHGSETRLLFRAALELRRELFDAACGVDQTLFPSVGGMRIHGDVARHDEVLDAINRLLAGRFHSGPGEEALAGSDIEEANVIERGMNFGFHGVENIDQPWRAL